MKLIFTSLAFFAFLAVTVAQTPQIAVVKPDGTTTIHTSFQTAYDASENDDKIYLPGGTFTAPAINKRLHIYGAGTFIDSSAVTKRTIVSNLTIGQAASGGSIEGLSLPDMVLHFHSNSFTLSNCVLGRGMYIQGNCSDNLFKNNVFGVSDHILNSVDGFGIMKDALFLNNFIRGNVYSVDSSFLKNNIFSKYDTAVPPNSEYENNIFKGLCCSTNNIFNNNVYEFIWSGGNNYGTNNFWEPWVDIFVDPGDLTNFSFYNNYHILPTSQCKDSGTDGTDRGIYGGDFPWPEGLVPSNPHIMFKQIPGTTNPNGNLQINVNVRIGD